MVTNKPKPVTWNEVKALLEAQGVNITAIAEGAADAHHDIKGIAARLETIATDVAVMKPALQKVVSDVAVMKPALQKVVSDMDVIKKDVATMNLSVGRIENRLDSFDERLKTVEAK